MRPKMLLTCCRMNCYTGTPCSPTIPIITDILLNKRQHILIFIISNLIFDVEVLVKPIIYCELLVLIEKWIQLWWPFPGTICTLSVWNPGLWYPRYLEISSKCRVSKEEWVSREGSLEEAVLRCSGWSFSNGGGWRPRHFFSRPPVR